MRATILSVLALVAALVFLLPLLWAASLSLRPPLMTFAVDGFGIPWLNYPPKLDAWRNELSDTRTLMALGRSTWIATAATLLAMVLATPAAWVLARSAPAGKGDLYVACFLVIRVLPPLAFVVPFYLFFWRLGLLDTGIALVIVNATLVLPLVVILMRQAFVDLPVELEEAAAIDGAGAFQIFASIVLPLATPALAATALILFAFAWNDYMFASAFFVLDLDTMPLRVAQSGSPGPGGAARMLLAIAIPVLMALVAQRWIIRGLTMGAVKG